MNKTELEAALTWLRTFNNNHSNTILARLLELESKNIKNEPVLHPCDSCRNQESKLCETCATNGDIKPSNWFPL